MSCKCLETFRKQMKPIIMWARIRPVTHRRQVISLRDSVCWPKASMFFLSRARLTSWSTVHPRLWCEHKSRVTTMQAIKYHRAVKLRRKYIFKKFHWDLWKRSCFFLFEKVFVKTRGHSFHRSCWAWSVQPCIKFMLKVCSSYFCLWVPQKHSERWSQLKFSIICRK